MSASQLRIEASHRVAITLLTVTSGEKERQALRTVVEDFGLVVESERQLGSSPVRGFELIAGSGSGLADLGKLKAGLLEVAMRFPGTDVAVQREDLYRRAKRLVVMDIDSTLISIEVIDELAKAAQVGEKVARITERAMRGEIEFDQSLKERVALLKGLPVAELEALAGRIPLTPGAETLIRTLKHQGYKIALISGGFSYFGEKLKESLGLQYVYTNELEITGGKLTGKVQGPIVNAARKAELLESIARQEGIPLESVVAIGDGANDIPMLGRAGLGIAFNAKPKTRQAAQASVNQTHISVILYLLGITDEDIAAATRL